MNHFRGDPTLVHDHNTTISTKPLLNNLILTTLKITINLAKGRNLVEAHLIENMQATGSKHHSK